jgi:hypothetical protein
MTETDFFNLYVERILQEVAELTKLKLLNETRILFLENNKKELLAQYQTLLEKQEKIQKKAAKQTKEVNTSDIF